MLQVLCLPLTPWITQPTSIILIWYHLETESFKPLFFTATSGGSASHINDTRGGHCSDASKKIYMKLEVYVCKRSNQTHQGNGKMTCGAVTS